MSKRLPPMRLTYAFPVEGGVTDVEVFVDMEWLRVVALRAVGNKKRCSQYAFARARVVGKRKYKNNPGKLDPDVAIIVQAYVEEHGRGDLETLRRTYADPANRKDIFYALARETPDGFEFPTFQQKTIDRALDILLLGAPEEIDAYLKLAEGVDYET